LHVRIAVVGKGGSGKSVIAGTIARLLARQSRKVLALDSDLLPGLAFSLGVAEPAWPPLLDAAEQDEDGRWRLKRGIGPVRAIQRYSTPAPDGVRLLQCGKTPPDGLGPIMGAVNAYYQVIHRLDRPRSLCEWSFVGDLPAGPRQTAFDWVPFARRVVVLVEPSWPSVLTALRIARIASSRRAVTTVPVGNKLTGAADRRLIERGLGTPLYAAIPADPAVADAERLGVAPIDHAPSSPAMSATEALLVSLLGEA
jgi:CO dehydrogenase maturation factor